MSFLELANYYYIQNVDTAIVFCEKAKDYSEKANYIDGRAESYAWLGYLANCKGNIIKSLEYNHKSLELQEETNNVAGMATSYNNIGAIYDSKGDKEKALKLEFLFEAKYDPNIGNISLGGDIVYLGTADKVKEIEKEWKKNKKLPNDVVEEVMGNILSKCNIEALIMSREINLPAPIPLPKVKSK